MKFGKKIKQSLMELKGTEYENIVNHLTLYPDCANFLKYYRDVIFTPEKLTIINQMIEENPDALRYVNFGVFQDEVFEIGAEFCKYIAKFPTISAQLLVIKQHNPELFKALATRFKMYEKIKENLDEIEVLITYSAKNVFDLQGKDIDIEDFLDCAYRDVDELINVEYGENYEKRLQEKLENEYFNATENEILNKSKLKNKLNVFMNRMYSLSLDGARKLLKEYGSDLDNLPNISQETKDFFTALKKALEMRDISEIDRAFYSKNIIGYTPTEVRKIKAEISRECAKSFAIEFKRTGKEIDGSETEEIEYDGKKIQQIRLKGKFNLLLHSTNAEFIKTKDKVEDFKDDWSKSEDKSKKNHIISMSYVNQDFMGTVPVKASGVRYAFTNLEYEDIRLMGVSDLNTYSRNFAYDSEKKQYMSAKTLPYSSRRVYSEFGIEREGKNPDYVVIMDDDLPEVIENSYKAAAQFGIPIVYVDKAEIEQEQIQRLEDLLNEFERTGDTSILQKLINSYETNVAGWLLNRSEEEDTSHTAGIDNTRFAKDFDVIRTRIEEIVKQFLVGDEKSPKPELEIYEVIKIILSEIELYEGCEKPYPISKTKISIDVNAILKSANTSLNTLGRGELEIDIDNPISRCEFELKIAGIVMQALSEEQPITMQDVEDARNFCEKGFVKTRRGVEK